MSISPDFDDDEETGLESIEEEAGELDESQSEDLGEGGGQDDARSENDGQNDQGRPERQDRVGKPRAAERIRALDRQNKELKERLDALERQRQAPAPSQAEIYEAQRLEQERLALMSPDERADYRINQTEQRMAQRLQRMEMQQLDQTNAARFEAKATVHPVYKKYADDVEARVAKIRRDSGNPNQFVDREIVLKVIIGERALEQASRATGKAGKRAAAATTRQAANGAGARGDQGSTRGQQGKTAAERLRGVLI